MNILLIPFSAGSLNKNIGCEKAPSAIIAKLSDFFSNEENQVNKIDQYDIQEVLVDNGNISLTFLEVETSVRAIMKKNTFEDSSEDSYENSFKTSYNNSFKNSYDKNSENNIRSEKGIKLIILGGDHSLTYPAFKASNCDGLIILDAHADAMEGTDAVTHEEFVRRLVDDEHIDPAKMLLVGLRHWEKSEMDFLKRKNIKFFSMKHVFDVGTESVCDAMMEFGRMAERLYLSIDIDVVDPAFAPGTGYLEPGGISARDLIYFVQRMKLLKNLQCVDIMEVNPEKDVREITVSLAAKIVNELN